MRRKIRRQLLPDAIYRQLYRSILEGSLKPGQRMVESELAEEFGTSRGPVREALRRLQAEGLAEHIDHKGTFVTSLTDQDIRDLFALRITLEQMTLRRAVPRMTSEDLKGLAALVEQMQEAAERGDMVAFGTSDFEFHATVCSTAGSKMLLSTWSSIGGNTRVAIASYARTRTYWHELPKAAATHGEILNAMKRGDSAAAIEANRRHLLEAMNRVGAKLPEL